MMELFKILGKIAVDSSEADRAIDETTGKAENSESRMTSAFKKIGAAVVACFAVDKIKDFGQAIINTGMEFDAQMSTVASISGATEEELEKLRAKAKEMGATTSFSAAESAQALEYMAMAGWKTEEMTNGLAGVMNLAAASGESLASTSDIVTDAMTAFGMKAEESTYFSDVLAKTASNANTNVGMMGETFKYVAPLAGAMGYSIEDMSVAVGLMANAGIKGSQSGTSLRGIITNLASPTDTVSGAMEALGISLMDSDGKTKSFSETLSDLRKSFADLDEVQKTQYASAIAGKEGMSGLLALVNSSDEDFEKLAGSIKNCSGAAEEMAKVRMDNLQGDVTTMKSAFEAAQIAFSEKLSPVLRTVVKKITEWIPKIQEKLTGMLGKIQQKFTENKDRLIELKDKFVDFAKYLIKTFSPAFSSLKDLFKNVVGAIKPVAEKILGLSDNSEKASESSGMLKTAIQFVADALEKASDILSGFVSWLTSGSAGAEAFKGVIKTLATGFVFYKGAMLAVTIAEKAQIAVTTALAAAHSLLNSMTPFGWATFAATALGALVVAAIKVSEPNNRMADEFAKLSDEEQALCDKTTQLTESYKKWSDARDGTMQNITEEYSSYEMLAEELGNIVDENGKIKEGYEERARIITGELSEALGIEIETVDGVIQKYSELQQSIKDTIEIKKAEAIQESMKDDYLEALKNIDEAQSNYNANLVEYNETFSEVKDTQEKLNTITGMTTEEFEKNALMLLGSQNAYMTQSEAVEYLQNKYDGLSEKFLGVRNRFIDTEKSFVDYNTTIKNYEGVSAAIVSKDSDKIKQANDNMLNSFQTAETGTERSLRNQVTSCETEYENMLKAYKQGNANITEADLKAKEELCNQSEEELNKYRELHGIKAAESGDEFANGVRSKTSEANAAGAEIGQEGVNGINSVDYATPGSDAGETYASNMINKARSIINNFINSDSYTSGESSVADYVAAVKSGNITRFANGGIVDRATIAQIGEDGPEAVVPLKNNTEWIDRVAEKVAGKLGKGGNGGGVTVNYIFENVNMNSDSDLEENAYKFEAMRRKAAMAMGGE